MVAVVLNRIPPPRPQPLSQKVPTHRVPILAMPGIEPEGAELRHRVGGVDDLANLA